MIYNHLKFAKQKTDILSVVVPAYNEEKVIKETISQIHEILKNHKITNEIVVVDDGSTDNTLQELIGIKRSVNLRIIQMSTNSGHMTAIRAGLEASIGNYVATIDADLQDPPEALPPMFDLISQTVLNNGKRVKSSQIQNDIDVIQAFRSDRSIDTLWKRKTAHLYYKIVQKITGISLVPHAADFRIMKKHVVDRLLSLQEKKLIYRLLLPSLGFKIVSFPIIRNERFAGKSKYDNKKMIALAVDSVLSFTNRPLRFLAFSGFTASVVLLMASFCTLLIYIFGSTIPGWTSLILLILSFNAFLFAAVGLVGEYVGRIYVLVQNRPETPWNEIRTKSNLQSK